MESKNNTHISNTALRELIASEDKRYEQRFSALDKTIDSEVKTQKTAMETALVAQKTAMETAFIAAEKVSSKTEVATNERFKSIEAILEQIRVQLLTLTPKTEWQITVDNFTKEIKEIKTYFLKNSGADESNTKNKTQSNWMIGIILAVITISISLISLFAVFYK